MPAFLVAVALLVGCSKSPAAAPVQPLAGPALANESPVVFAESTPAIDTDEPAPTSPAQRPQLRVWKDRGGKHETSAAFVAWEAGKVALRKANGDYASVPVEKLSTDDHDYLRGQGVFADFTKRQIVGRVVGVTDGDTITVLDEHNEQHKIRLNGIDAPESGQAFGTESRKALSGKVFGKQVRIDWYELDKYGRVLGDVFVGNRLVNKELLEEGHAWHFKKYSHDPKLAEAENSAHRKLLGLWADQNRIAPWVYRENEKAAAKVKNQPAAKPAVPAPTLVSEPVQTPPSYDPPPRSTASDRPKTVHVEGYYRKDGTYVKPHDRAAPRRKK